MLQYLTGWLSMLLLLGLFASPSLAAESPPLAGSRPPTIRVGGLVGEGWPPFAIVQNGQVSGMSVDFLRAALGADQAQRIVLITFPDMPALIAAACANQVDVVMNIVQTIERERCLRFSIPYFSANTVIIGRASSQNGGDLAHARIAVERGYFVEEWLRSRFPQARFVQVKSVEAGLQAVSDGSADSYPTMQQVADFYLRRPEYAGLAVQTSYFGSGSDVRFAFSPAAAGLKPEIDRGLSAISPEQRRAIIGRWVTPPLSKAATAPEFFLTKEEQAYLQALPALKVAFDDAAPPYSYLDENGRPSGMAADYLSYLSRMLGLRFQREASAPFMEAVTALRQGKGDLLAAGVRGDPALAGIYLSRPYATFPLVIVGRQAAVAVEGVKDLVGKRVVVSDGGGVQGPLLAAAPGLQVTTISSVHAAMEAVANGEADAYVDELATVDGELQRNYAGTLRVIGSVGQTVDITFAIAPKLGPQLVALVDRAMAHMPEQERLAIQNRYVAAPNAVEMSWREVFRRIAPYLAGVVILIAILLGAYLRLRRHARATLQAQRRLQTQLDFQRTLVDAIPFPITVKDSDGRYAEVNVAYVALCGRSRQQLIGTLPTDTAHLSHGVGVALHAGFLQAMATRQLHQFAVDCPQDDGRLLHFLVWAQPIMEEGEAPSGVISAAVDVTAIRAAEAKARASEAMLIDVTRHLPTTVFRLREHEGSYTYDWVSGNAMEMFGRPATALIGQTDPLKDLVFPEDDARARTNIALAQLTQQFVTEDRRFLVRGQMRWIRVHGMPQHEPDGSTLWHGYFADVTEERARADALAQAKDAAEAASRAKDSFLAMMSHEIRTPMNGVRGLVELLQKTPLNAEQHRMLALAGESGQALSQILDDILDYAKLDAGRLKILAAPVDLRGLFDGVMDSLLPQALSKGLRLKQWVAVDVPAEAEIDSIRVRQILFNLLGNAIKFTPQGSVMLRASVEEGEGGEGGASTLVVSVEDTGIGIAAEELERLFEPFVQSERSSTRKFGGTGLGLSISRRLAQLMEGEVSLASSDGVGTRAVLRVPCKVARQDYDLPGLRQRPLAVRVADPVRRQALLAYGEKAGMRCLGENEVLPAEGVLIEETVEAPGSASGQGKHRISLSDDFLPLGYRQEASGTALSVNPLRWTAFVTALEMELKLTMPAAQSSTPGHEGDVTESAPCGPSVLIVEDHPINQEVIQRQLSVLGYRTTVQGNGQEAWAALKTGTFDLVLTDCHMPLMDGFELTRLIRASEQPALRRLPVVGLTATIAREEHALCLEVGMNTFLVKPTTMEVLQQTIETVLQESAGAKASVSVATAQAPLASQGVSGTEESCLERIDINKLRAHLDVMLMGQDMRQVFHRALQDDCDALRGLLTGPLPGELGKWCRRANRALSSLDQPHLVELAQRLEARCKEGAPAGIQAAAAPLLAMYEQLLELLAQPGTACAANTTQQPTATGQDPLAEIRGLDLNTGLRHVMGDRDCYERLLRHFVEREAGAGAAIMSALARGDRETAQRCAHSLRGVAATMGAEALTAAAARVESKLATGQDVDPSGEALGALEVELSQLTNAIAAVVPEQHSIAPADELPAAIMQSILQELGALLDAGDAQALALFAEHHAVLAARYGEALHALAETMSACDFEAAHGELLRLTLSIAG
ncbi:MAG TPA: transporter substrate-binding domain-containing protein [Rhodocyclaceae bacterium]|nr:transporter substrate-binding domain-containing protein [Rhodocyclaceae bacterium]